MKKTRNSILASLVAATTILTACGCQSKQAKQNVDEAAGSADATVKDGIVSENIFTDFQYMSEMESIASADVSVALAFPDTMNLDTKVSLKSTEKLCQVDIPKFVIEMPANEEGEEDTKYDFSDLSLIIDSEGQMVYIGEAGVRSILELAAGGQLDLSSFECDAEWLTITLDEASETVGVEIPEGTEDAEKFKKLYEDTIAPELKDAFKDSEDKFFTEDKHGIKLDNENLVVFADIVLTMCEDGSIKAILDAANQAELIPADKDYQYDETVEDFVEVEVPFDAEAAISDIKETFTSMKEGLTDTDGVIDAKLVTSVSGKKGATTANCTITANITAPTDEDGTAGDTAKMTVDCKVTEGTAEITVPTSTMTFEDYTESMQTAMGMGTAGEEPTETEVNPDAA